MQFDSKSQYKPIGRVKLQAVCALTGEPINTTPLKNAIVLDAKYSILHAISSESTDHIIRQLKIGNDVGTGTEEVPEPANETYDATTMNVLYVLPSTLVVGYSDSNSVTFTATIIGREVIEANGGGVSITFTSAALHTGDGRVFAYVRFPSETLSPLININVSWTVSWAV